MGEKKSRCISEALCLNWAIRMQISTSRSATKNRPRRRGVNQPMRTTGGSRFLQESGTNEVCCGQPDLSQMVERQLAGDSKAIEEYNVALYSVKCVIRECQIMGCLSKLRVRE